MKNYTNKIIIESLKLPMIETFDDLISRIGLTGNLMYWLINDDKNKYETFSIPKRDGSKREINAPCDSLKIVQRWILVNVLYKLETSPYSYGFNNKSAASPTLLCAEQHKNNLYLMKVDFKDFYPSIKRKQVYYLFKNMGYNTDVSNWFTDLCIYNGKLPQGAVTSAHIANLICRKLDYRIAGYCNKHDITFTRYADDMTFSSDNKQSFKNLYPLVAKIAYEEGFKINKKKTIVMTPKTRKTVLGVTINDSKTKAPKELKRNLRAMIHYEMAIGNYSKNDIIRGYISYISTIEPQYRKNIEQYIVKLSESHLALYSDLVDKYNLNKIIQSLPDMKLKDPTDFVEQDDVAGFLENNENENYEFVKYATLKF